MKLICVNSETIVFTNIRRTCTGDGLVEGKMYTTKCKDFKDAYGELNYYIDGLGSKLKCRFAQVEDDKEMIISAEKKEEVKKDLLEPCKN